MLAGWPAAVGDEGVEASSPSPADSSDRDMREAEVAEGLCERCRRSNEAVVDAASKEEAAADEREACSGDSACTGAEDESVEAADAAARLRSGATPDSGKRAVLGEAPRAGLGGECRPLAASAPPADPPLPPALRAA